MMYEKSQGVQLGRQQRAARIGDRTALHLHGQLPDAVCIRGLAPSEQGAHRSYSGDGIFTNRSRNW